MDEGIVLKYSRKLKMTYLFKNTFLIRNYLSFHKELSCETLSKQLEKDLLYTLALDGAQLVEFVTIPADKSQ